MAKKTHPHANTHSSHLSNAKCTQFINERRSRQCGTLLRSCTHTHEHTGAFHSRTNTTPNDDDKCTRREREKKKFETIFQPLYFDKLKNESKRCESVYYLCAGFWFHSLTHPLPVIYRFSNMYYFFSIFYLRAAAAATAVDATDDATNAITFSHTKKSAALESLQRAQRSARNSTLNQDRFWTVDDEWNGFEHHREYPDPEQPRYCQVKWDKLFYFIFAFGRAQIGTAFSFQFFHSHRVHYGFTVLIISHTHAWRIGCRIEWLNAIFQSVVTWGTTHVVLPGDMNRKRLG